MTSKTPSETTPEEAYPTWNEIVSELPARWRLVLEGSTARLVSFKGGYVIDINGFDTEAFSAACSGDFLFKAELLKLVLPWGMDHPAIKGRHRCRGIVFGSDLGNPVLRKFGRLINFVPRRWS